MIWFKSSHSCFSLKQTNIELLGGSVCFVPTKLPLTLDPDLHKVSLQSQMAVMNCGQLSKSSAAPLDVFKCYLSFCFSKVEIRHLWPRRQKAVREPCVWMRGHDKVVWPLKADTTLLSRHFLLEWNQWCGTLHTEWRRGGLVCTSDSCDIGLAAVNEALILTEMQAIFVLSRPESLQS